MDANAEEPTPRADPDASSTVAITGSPAAAPTIERAPSTIVPRSSSLIGSYWPFGHHAATAARRRAAVPTTTALRYAGLPSDAAHIRRDILRPIRVSRY